MLNMAFDNSEQVWDAPTSDLLRTDEAHSDRDCGAVLLVKHSHVAEQ